MVLRMAVNLTVEDRGCGRIRRNLMTIIAYSDHPELRRIFAAQEAENAQGSPAETCVSTKTRPCPLRVKLRNTQAEQIFSGLPSTSDIARQRATPTILRS
jgi:hypothetical protein